MTQSVLQVAGYTVKCMLAAPKFTAVSHSSDYSWRSPSHLLVIHMVAPTACYPVCCIPWASTCLAHTCSLVLIEVAAHSPPPAFVQEVHAARGPGCKTAPRRCTVEGPLSMYAPLNQACADSLVAACEAVLAGDTVMLHPVCLTYFFCAASLMRRDDICERVLPDHLLARYAITLCSSYFHF